MGKEGDMGLSLGAGEVENERNQIFNYRTYDKKHVATLLSSSLLAMSVAHFVLSQHSSINHLCDPIPFTLFPHPISCPSHCYLSFPSLGCSFPVFHSHFSLRLPCVFSALSHTHTCIQKPPVSYNGSERKVNRALPYKVDASYLALC